MRHSTIAVLTILGIVFVQQKDGLGQFPMNSGGFGGRGGTSFNPYGPSASSPNGVFPAGGNFAGGVNPFAPSSNGFNGQMNPFGSTPMQGFAGNFTPPTRSAGEETKMIGDLFGGSGGLDIGFKNISATIANPTPGMIAKITSGTPIASGMPNDQKIINAFFQLVPLRSVGPVPDSRTFPVEFDPDATLDPNVSLVYSALGTNPQVTGSVTTTTTYPNEPGNYTPVYNSRLNVERVSYTLPINQALVGRLKASENATILPTDRVYLNYSKFYDVPLLPPNGIDIKRFTPGFEKTFAGGVASIEGRLPFAISLDEDIGIFPISADMGFQLGNAQLGLKVALFNLRNSIVTGGCYFNFPTARGINILTPSILRPEAPESLLRVHNRSIHIMPFMGITSMPVTGSPIFWKGIAQLDFATNGDPVTNAQLSIDNGNFSTVSAGRIRDATNLYLDVATGFWLYRNPNGTYRGIAPTVEMHYNQQFSDAKSVDAELIRSGDSTFFVEVSHAKGTAYNLNMVLGTHVLVGPQDTYTVAYTLPVADDGNRPFDGELRLLFNRTF